MILTNFLPLWNETALGEAGEAKRQGGQGGIIEQVSVSLVSPLFLVSLVSS